MAERWVAEGRERTHDRGGAFELSEAENGGCGVVEYVEESCGLVRAVTVRLQSEDIKAGGAIMISDHLRGRANESEET